MPIDISWIPPKKTITVIREAQPGTVVVGLKNFSRMLQMNTPKAMIVARNPIKKLIFNGVVLKPVMPSIAKRSIFRSGYLEVPAVRSLRS